MPIKGTYQALVFGALLVASPAFAQSVEGALRERYKGLQLGSAFSDFSSPALAFDRFESSDRVAPEGVQFGYNWQRGDLVFGAVADFSLSNEDANDQFNDDVLGSLRFRTGGLVGNTVIFGSLGVAWAEGDVDFGNDRDGQPGLILGGGAERWLSEGLLGRVEAYYLDVPIEGQGAGSTSSASDNLYFRAGLSLHF